MPPDDDDNEDDDATPTQRLGGATESHGSPLSSADSPPSGVLNVVLAVAVLSCSVAILGK